MADPDVRPERMLDVLGAHRDATVDERHRWMLNTYLHHLQAEFDADVDEAMHSLVAEPVFRFWCGYRDAEGPTALPGPVIRANYERVFAHGFPAIEIRPERVLVSDDGIAIEGEQHSVVEGGQLHAQGVDADAGKRYHMVCRFALVIEFVDDLMVGEDHYWPQPFALTEVTA